MGDDTDDLLLKKYKNTTTQNFGDKYIPNPYLSDSTEKVENAFSSAQLDIFGDTNWRVSKIFGEADKYTDLPTDTNYNNKLLYRNLITPGTPGYVSANVSVWKMTYATDDAIGYNNQLQLCGVIAGMQPYVGFLDNPYIPTRDINYGAASYYNHGTPTSANNLVWRYWRKKISQYLNVNSKQLTCYMWLNHSDMANLNWRRKIYVDGQLYRLSKIVDWSSLSASKVELLMDTYLDEDAYINTDVNTLSSSLTTFSHNTPFRYKMVQELKPKLVSLDTSTITGTTTDIEILSGYTFNDTTNYYDPTFAGLINGSGNIVNNDKFIIRGDNNITNSDETVILNSDNNELCGGSRNILLNSKMNVIASGVSNTILLNESGLTITESGDSYSTFIGNVKYLETTKALVIDDRGKVYYSYFNGGSGSTWCNWDGGRPCEVYGGIPIIDGGYITC
jgi:hypothetical protein